ncbi:MAG: hypothetical protein ABI130_06750, partial [Leifsonia sp.]
ILLLGSGLAWLLISRSVKRSVFAAEVAAAFTPVPAHPVAAHPVPEAESDAAAEPVGVSAP